MPELSREVVLEALQRAAWDKRRAAMEYRAAVEQAHAQGWKHTEIARAVGVSEGAIRLYLKRGQPKGRRRARRRG